MFGLLSYEEVVNWFGNLYLCIWNWNLFYINKLIFSLNVLIRFVNIFYFCIFVRNISQIYVVLRIFVVSYLFFLFFNFDEEYFQVY